MNTAPPSTALAPIKPAFSESLALAGFLAGYRGLTREAFTLNLRKFTVWCRARSLALFSVRRADIETFARELEARAAPGPPSPGGYPPSRASISTPSRKSSSITPRAAHVRRPRPDYESHATATSWACSSSRPGLARQPSAPMSGRPPISSQRSSPEPPGSPSRICGPLAVVRPTCGPRSLKSPPPAREPPNAWRHIRLRR
jgi:hypothetical protein